MDHGVRTIEELWIEAEEALEASSKRAESLLTKLASKAEEGSDASLFAYRHLAELNLERDPWKAALQLRRVLASCDDDDVVHALMGLCHALLGNYRVAVRSYRASLKESICIQSARYCISQCRNGEMFVSRSQSKHYYIALTGIATQLFTKLHSMGLRSRSERHIPAMKWHAITRTE